MLGSMTVPILTCGYAVLPLRISCNGELYGMHAPSRLKARCTPVTVCRCIAGRHADGSCPSSLGGLMHGQSDAVT